MVNGGTVNLWTAYEISIEQVVCLQYIFIGGLSNDSNTELHIFLCFLFNRYFESLGSFPVMGGYASIYQETHGPLDRTLLFARTQRQTMSPKSRL